MRAAAWIKRGLCGISMVTLVACGAADGTGETGDESVVSTPASGSKLQTCTPSYSRTCDPWGGAACVRRDARSQCLEWAAFRWCYEYTQNYDCSTSTRTKMDSKTWY